MVDSPPPLDYFTHKEAWQLGAHLTQQCQSERRPVTIGIWIGNQRVFHAALEGSTIDNDRWIERKANITRHFALSSAQVAETYVRDSVEDFLRAFALPIERYFPAGGALPIVVLGTMVGVLAISGLASDEDHQYGLQALRGLAAIQASDA